MNTITPLGFSLTAADIFQRIKQEKHVFFLDSSMQAEEGRYSYLGCNPFDVITSSNWLKLRGTLKKYKQRQKGPYALAAGAVGYIAYEGEYCFGLYDTVIIVDHYLQKAFIGAPNKKRKEEVMGLLAQSPSLSKEPIKAKLDFKSWVTKAQYVKALQKALARIARGDIYQINLSHRIDVRLNRGQGRVSAPDVYLALRRQSPSCFGAYFDQGGMQVLSASPERFLRFDGKIAQVKPMKGTRPRGKGKAEDATYRKQLLESPKEIAELLMVTDLERNDLGRVCDYASVKVKALRTIEEYATVFQATSTIEGVLHKKFDQVDLLKAVFPSGSVTGCPKIAAMGIIKELEKGPRGLYTGALGYISFDGRMDFNVMIRTLFVEKHKMSFNVGGGIVADSKPSAEWEETWVKAQGMIKALKEVYRS